MGSDSDSKGPGKNGPQAVFLAETKSEGSWLFARNPVSGTVPLAKKVEQAVQLVGKLTLVERRILDLMVNGYGPRAIAEKTGLQPETVTTEKASLLAKLGAKTSTDAIRVGFYAQAHFPLHLVPLPD